MDRGKTEVDSNSSKSWCRMCAAMTPTQCGVKEQGNLSEELVVLLSYDNSPHLPL